ncbi:MAG: efflux RND transporter periplasmic adaptor subunit [Hyphomicrobiaceae bacterium]
MWRRSVLVSVGLIGLAVAVYAFLTNRPVTLPVAHVEMNVPVRVFGLGTVEARVLSRIGFEVEGAIVDLQADHGDVVKQGSVLARLSPAKQEARVAKAKAGLLSAEVGVQRAEANVAKSRAVLAQREEANKRKKALVRRDIVSEQTAEEAQRDEDVAKAELSVALSEVEVAGANLETARSELALEVAVLDQHALIAPFDGIVIERHKELGTVVKSGEPVFSLVANDSYWGLAYVDEARSGYIAEGQTVEARLRSRPLDLFTGQVARVGLESDRVSEERRVYIKGENPPPRVHLGEQAEFWITVTVLDKALLVPEAAVQGFDGRQGTVWTIRDGRLERQRLSFRHRTEDARLEVAGGLTQGAEVVVAPAAGLREGRRASAATEASP